MGSSVYPLDHLVLPVVTIAAARERLSKLGFTVAPEARHPFGTENACVFLADKTYLEPLGVASREECIRSAEAGNVFTARDQAFRFRVGEGLSAVVFGSADAAGDDTRFGAEGMSAGRPLEFSRPVLMPDGSQSVAGFRLAFASDLRAPDFFVFCCERMNPLPADRGVLERHVNGVTAIAEVALCAPKPADFSTFLGHAANGADIVEHSFGLTLETANVRLTVFTPEGMEVFYDQVAASSDPGLEGRAVLYRVSDLSVTEAHLAANGVTYTRRNNRLIVKPAPGQGVIFAFEETL